MADDQDERDKRDDEEEQSPPAVRLPSRAAMASPLDSAIAMPSVASPLAMETTMAPVSGALTEPQEQTQPQIQSPYASSRVNPDPYGEYKARIASPHGIEAIHNPFLRGLARVGDVAGMALAPGLTAAIPGTTLNERLQERHLLNRGKALENENEQALKDTGTQATTEETKARTANIEKQTEQLGQPKPKEEKWSDFKGWINPDTQNPLEHEENSGTLRDAVTKQPVQHAIAQPNQKPETQEQNRKAFQDTIAKVSGAGLPTGPQQLDKSLDDALKNKTITQAEHDAARGYLAANPTPTTQITNRIAGAEATQAIHNANQWYRWKDANGKIVEGRGTKVPQGIEADPIGTEKDFATHQREGKMSNAVQQSFNRLAEDIDKHPELFDNDAARAIMATTLEQVDRTAAGFLVAGTGGQIPLPSGLGDTINAALQNKALDDKTARALKDYIADYRGMKDMAVVMQMEMQGGRIGRGSQQVFQAIVNQLPNGSTPDSQTAKRLVQNFQQKQNVIQSEHADEGKEKPYEIKEQKGGAAEIPEGARGTWRGQPVVRQGGKWVPAPAQR